MSEFKDVSVVREANIYFGGQVTSRTVIFADGTRQTLGIMLPGDYEFATAAEELMEILSGELAVKLPGAQTWQALKGGDSFAVPASSRFSLKVTAVTDYCCAYLE